MSNSNDSTTKSSINNAMMESAGSNDAQGIHRLFHLESLLRMKEDETNIKKQLEEKVQKFEHAKADHASLFEQYAKIQKIIGVRTMLEQINVIPDEKLLEFKENVENMLEKIQPERIDAFVNNEELIACKENLKEVPNYENVDKQYEKLNERKKCLEELRKVANNVHNLLLCGSIEQLDNIVDKFQK